jgi:hypothetical protein
MLPRNSTMRTRFGRYRRHDTSPEWASLVVAIHFRRDMNFTDPQLQKCYEASLAEPSTCPDDLRPISALIAAHETFRMLEGPHSARVHEVIENLLRPGSRAALRHWYQQPHAADDSDKADFRKQLSHLAGESL